MRNKLTLLLLFVATISFAQKKPLDHSVYDKWEALGGRQLSNNGQWLMYSVNQQEGDANVSFVNLTTNGRIQVSRGVVSGAERQFTNDSKFAALLVKPWFADTRMAKIKKKKGDALTKDTLAIINLTSQAVTRVARVKSYKMPKEGAALIAYQMEKPLDTARKKPAGEDATPKNDDADTLADDEPGDAPGKNEGTDLVFKNLTTGVERVFKFVTDYSFSKNGKQLVFAASGSKKDATAPVGVFVYNTETGAMKTLVNTKGNYKGFIFDDSDENLAFLGEQSPEKQENKDFKIFYNNIDLNTAQEIVDANVPGIPAKWAVSGDGRLNFSKDGKRLFFGLAPIKVPKDTTLIDFENAKLDIWGYKDDYLQTQQLKTADRDSKRTFLSAFDIFSADGRVVPLTNINIPDASLVNEGDADFVLASSDYGNRVASQWTGSSLRDYYLVNTKTGAAKRVIEKFNGNVMASPNGTYLLYFDRTNSNWYTYQVATGKVSHLNANMPVKFADEENDVPDYASSYGVAGWLEDDKAVLLHDRYDIWQFSPDGKTPAKNLTNGFGRTNKITLRIERLDPEARTISTKTPVWLDAVNNVTKESGFYKKNLNDKKDPELVIMSGNKYSALLKAKDGMRFVYDKSNYTNSPDLYTSMDLKTETRLSSTNPQQDTYLWGTAELVKWTTPKGYASEGVLYKPENFDPNKKYPMIVYFYEKSSQELNTYIPPTPTGSKLNISYFVSNGYLVFTPDITYEIGYPGRSAEEFINSGVEALKKNAWVDGTKIGIQGQSWGGYQVAHLITRTNMYAAAWSGAPVVNMTSAYGGIRWESGVNRQFQYEKTQSRIGATLWEKPDLYIENSPLFHLPKVNTPVAIMSNDADGAVPWYQGIEFFTALKRLGKPAWLLNYNNEAHNLVQRQNKKDIQIRQQQFFDHYLKGAKAPKWMTTGVAALEKGRNWGFELTDDKP